MNYAIFLALVAIVKVLVHGDALNERQFLRQRPQFGTKFDTINNGWVYITTRQRIDTVRLSKLKQIVAVFGEATKVCIKMSFIFNKTSSVVSVVHSRMVHCLREEEQISVEYFSDQNCEEQTYSETISLEDYMTSTLANKNIVSPLTSNPLTFEAFCTNKSEFPLPDHVNFATNITYDQLNDCRAERTPLFFESYRMDYCLAILDRQFGSYFVQYSLPNVYFFHNPLCHFTTIDGLGLYQSAIARINKCRVPGSYTRFYPEHNYPRKLASEQAAPENVENPYNAYYTNYYNDDNTVDAPTTEGDDQFDDDATADQALPDPNKIWYVSEWKQTYQRTPTVSPTTIPGKSEQALTTAPTTQPTKQEIYSFTVEQELSGITLSTYKQSHEQYELNNMIFSKVIAKITGLPRNCVKVQSVLDRPTLTTDSSTADTTDTKSNIIVNKINQLAMYIGSFVSKHGTTKLNNNNKICVYVQYTIQFNIRTMSNSTYVAQPEHIYSDLTAKLSADTSIYTSQIQYYSAQKSSTSLTAVSPNRPVVSELSLTDTENTVNLNEKSGKSLNIIVAIIYAVLALIVVVVILSCVYKHCCGHSKILPMDDSDGSGGSFNNSIDSQRLKQRVKPVPSSSKWSLFITTRDNSKENDLNMRNLSRHSNTAHIVMSAISNTINNNNSSSNIYYNSNNNKNNSRSISANVVELYQIKDYAKDDTAADLKVFSDDSSSCDYQVSQRQQDHINNDEVTAFDLAGLTIEAMESELREIQNRVLSKPPHTQEIGEVGGPGGYVSHTFYPADLNKFFV